MYVGACTELKAIALHTAIPCVNVRAFIETVHGSFNLTLLSRCRELAARLDERG